MVIDPVIKFFPSHLQKYNIIEASLLRQHACIKKVVKTSLRLVKTCVLSGY